MDTKLDLDGKLEKKFRKIRVKVGVRGPSRVRLRDRYRGWGLVSRRFNIRSKMPRQIKKPLVDRLWVENRWHRYYDSVAIRVITYRRSKKIRKKFAKDKSWGFTSMLYELGVRLKVHRSLYK